MAKKAQFNWDDVAELIVVLKGGKRIVLGEKEVKKVVSCLVLAAAHGL